MTPEAPQAEVWTIQKLLESMQSYLNARRIPSARLDAEVLLCFVLNVERIYLYTHFDKPITDAERGALRGLIKRRGRYEPIAYICGRKEFYSRSFYVDPAVLIPRPETEHIIEAVTAWAGTRGQAPLRILDVGTGSGILAITLACQWPQSEVWATDISSDALQVAARNACTHKVASRVHFFQGDLFAALPAQAAPEAFDIIVSNPPYVAQDATSIQQADVYDFEPHTALFAGPDGLDILKRLCQEAFAYAGPQSCLALEMGWDQHDAVKRLLCAQPWESLQVVHDLQGHPRVMVAGKGPRPQALQPLNPAHDFEPSPDPELQHDDAPSFDINTATQRMRVL